MVNREDYEAMGLDSRLELIRSLIPLGLMAVCEELEAGSRQPGRRAAQPLAETSQVTVWDRR